MAIRRGKRPDTKFYAVSKDISEDIRLSWSARGMLIFLLGKPDNWQVSVAHLIKQTSESARGTSRDGVRAIIKELVDTGYMQVDGVRNDSGTFGGINYVVSESPETDLPTPVKRRVKAQKNSEPETGFPLPVEPLPVNPPLIKNDFKQRLINQTKTELITEPDKSVPVPGGILAGEVLLKSEQSTPEAKQETEVQRKCREAWSAYKTAYHHRYGTDPIRNAKINALVKQLVQRLGSESSGVAEYFVRNVNEAFVVRQMHDLGLLVGKAEMYRTQWATGQSMTNTRAQQIDQSQANYNAADEAKAMLRAKRAGGSNAN